MSKSSGLVRYFLSHRSVTNQLIEKIEKKDYDYKPTPTSMPTKKLVIHMLTSFYTFAAKAAKLDQVLLHNEEEEIDLFQIARIYTDETVKLIESLSDEQLKEIIDLTDMLGVQMPAERLIQVAIDHEINHKGNLFVYVRLLGHTDLPFFVQK